MYHIFIFVTLPIRLFSPDYHYLSLGAVTVLLEKTEG